MRMTDVRIQNVSVDPDGSLQISYLRTGTDIKANGVMHLHTICIPVGADYDDEIQALLDAGAHAVLDCLEDLANLEPLRDDSEDPPVVPWVP